MYTNVGEGEDDEEMKMQWSNGARKRYVPCKESDCGVNPRGGEVRGNFWLFPARYGKNRR